MVAPRRARGPARFGRGPDMFATLTAILEFLGVVVFAVTGTLVASRKQLDIVGFILLGTVTGIGGGTMRDVLIGLTPVFWIREPSWVAVCTVVSCLMFFLAHIPKSRLRLLLWLDAAGMALFASIGAETALGAGVGALAAVAMGVMTATFGGIIRDVLGGEKPVVLSQEVYVTAALAGAAVFVLLDRAGAAREIALAGGFALAFAVRTAALTWNWTLPRHRPRPVRSD